LRHFNSINESGAGCLRPHDHFTAYPKRRLLIFAALGNNTVEVINTFEGKVIQSIKGLNEPQAYCSFRKSTSSSWPTQQPARSTFMTARRGTSQEYPDWRRSDTDNLRYDEATKRVYVGIVGGIAMIDAATEMHVGKDLKGSGVTPSRSSWKRRGPAFSSTCRMTTVSLT